MKATGNFTLVIVREVKNNYGVILDRKNLILVFCVANMFAALIFIIYMFKKNAASC